MTIRRTARGITLWIVVVVPTIAAVGSAHAQGVTPSASTLAGPILVSTNHAPPSSAQSFLPPPSIAGFWPNQGPPGLGVLVTGANFHDVIGVEFNGVPAPWSLRSPNTLEATVPVDATSGPITVVSPMGSATSADTFRVQPPFDGTINLSWDDCGAAGSVRKTFACDDNAGAPFTLVGSFVPPGMLPEFLGVTVDMDIRWNTTTVPDWWQLRSGLQPQLGLCRDTTGLMINFDFRAGPFSCLDFFVGAAYGEFIYIIGNGLQNHARLRIQAAVPVENRGPVDSQSEWYAFKVNLLRAKTTGPGSCMGCVEPTCIVLNEIQLHQSPDLSYHPRITTSGVRNYVDWQGGLASCPAATPVQVSLVTAEATPDRVRLVWQTEDVERATVHRREGEGTWRLIATVLPDGQHRVRFEDTDVEPGATYDYRLGVPVPAGEVYLGETRVTVPMSAPTPLALARVDWNASAGALAISMSLPQGGSASFELFDVNGRRLMGEQLDGLETGSHDLNVRPAVPLKPGVFFARLTQDREGVSRRFVVVQ